MQSESIPVKWYIICNPTSGGGNNQKKIDYIISILDKNEIPYHFTLTDYAHHEEKLVQSAIKNGYIRFICIGGDGTLHHIVNGIMKQEFTDTRRIKLAVIPSGTGNDWVKNYNIPTDPLKAIQLILKDRFIYQDVGKINLIDENRTIFFHNAAGIGFDAFVVKNIKHYKKWRSLAYLVAALASFSSFKQKDLAYSFDSDNYTTKVFMMVLGICKYSGGGMQLTDFKNHKKGFFDLTLIKKISLLSVITQITKLYNGNISAVKEVYCSQIQKLKIESNTAFYIQADGELVGKGPIEIDLVTGAIQFVIC